MGIGLYFDNWKISIKLEKILKLSHHYVLVSMLLLWASLTSLYLSDLNK